MKKQSSKNIEDFEQQIQQLNKEIKSLKVQLPKIHLTRSAENDYDIKSQIIKKQNELIELLYEQAIRLMKE